MEERTLLMVDVAENVNQVSKYGVFHASGISIESKGILIDLQDLCHEPDKESELTIPPLWVVELQG